MKQLLAACLVLLLAAPALAHRLAPSFLQLREQTPGRVELLWKTPRMVAIGARPAPRVPQGCMPQGEPVLEAQADAFVERRALVCPGGLMGRTLAVDGLARSGTDALVEVVLADGSERRAILSARQPSYVVPPTESRAAVARSYGALGVEHLLTGLDHVLFVTGLVFLVGLRRRLFGAITAFTAGHSLTLALASLGLVHIPPDLAEIGIAASLVLLAGELVAVEQGAPSVLSRRPWIMSFGFGLVHGLGFAGALAALGLPAQAIPLALFSFNVGIEVGQLALVLLLLPAVFALGRLPSRAPRWLAELPATAIGSLGVFWILQRGAHWLLG